MDIYSRLGIPRPPRTRRVCSLDLRGRKAVYSVLSAVNIPDSGRIVIAPLGRNVARNQPIPAEPPLPPDFAPLLGYHVLPAGVEGNNQELPQLAQWMALNAEVPDRNDLPDVPVVEDEPHLDHDVLHVQVFPAAPVGGLAPAPRGGIFASMINAASAIIMATADAACGTVGAAFFVIWVFHLLSR